MFYLDTPYPHIKKIVRSKEDAICIYANMLNRRWIVKHDSCDICTLGDPDLESLGIETQEEESVGWQSDPSVYNVQLVYLNLTYNCNLRCPGCYTENYTKGSQLDPSKHNVLVKKFKNLGVKSLCVLGGEPLLYKDINQLLKAFIREGISDITVVTNGILIDRLDLDFIKEAGITLQVSLDSIDQAVSEKTRPRLKVDPLITKVLGLKDAGIRTLVMGTLTKENIHASFDMYKFFRERGIDTGFFQFKNNGIENLHLKPDINDLIGLFDQIFEYTKDVNDAVYAVKVIDNMKLPTPGFPIVHCGAGLNAVSIAPDGKVYPCVKLTDDNLCLGNIFDEDFKIKTHLPFVNEIDFCKDCEIKYFCGGCCRAERYYIDEHFNADSGCSIYKGLLNYYFRKILDSHEKQVVMETGQTEVPSNLNWSRFNMVMHLKGKSYLYNTFTGSLTGYRDYLDVKPDEIEEDLKNSFYKSGFLVESSPDQELENIFSSLNDQIMRSKHLKLTIIPTWDCNFRCTYCFQKHDVLSIGNETIETISEFFKKYRFDYNSYRVMWWGGEPILALDRMKQITGNLLEILPEGSYRASVITNGFLLEKLRAIYKDLAIDHVQVTLDGGRDVHNSRRKHVDGGDTYSAILDGLNAMAQTTEIPDVVLRMNLDTENIDGFDAMYQELDAALDKRIEIYPAIVENYSSQICNTSDNRSVTHSESFLMKYANVLTSKNYKRIGNHSKLSFIASYCGNEFNSNLTVTPDGYVYNCWGWSADKNKGLCHLSDFRLRKELVGRTTYEEKCQHCKLFPLCMGGCSFVSSPEFCRNKFFLMKYSLKALLDTRAKENIEQ